MNRLRLTAFVLFILPLSLLGQARSPEAGYRSTVERARQYLRDSMAVARIPGVSITVSIGGTVVWSEGFGYADLEQRVPVTTRTKFRVGSVSKPLTATALAMLWEQGKLSLDSTVQAYVPSFPRKRWPITVRQVAGHIAGIRHYKSDAEMTITRRYRSVGEALTVFEDDSLLFPPGTRFQYSSFGWNLLSAVVEGASGQPFLSYMTSHVFGPLGLSQTVPDYSDSLIPDRARWYTEDSHGTVINAPFADNSYKWAGGGFLSTTEDLARFGDAMLDHRILKPATVDLMWTPLRLADGTPTSYGLGWFIRTDAKGRTVVSHTGGSIGGTAHLYLVPSDHLVVAMLVNSDMRFIHHAPRIAEMFLEERGGTRQ